MAKQREKMLRDLDDLQSSMMLQALDEQEKDLAKMRRRIEIDWDGMVTEVKGGGMGGLS